MKSPNNTIILGKPRQKCGSKERYKREPHQCVACCRVYRRLGRVKERRNELQLSKRRADVRGQMVHSARQSAKKYGRAHTITKDDIVIPSYCPLLGIPLFIGGGKVADNSPTLDRIDSALGYVPGNVWVISHRANRIKNNATLAEMELIVNNWRFLQSLR
jgi:hypothetical protein